MKSIYDIELNSAEGTSNFLEQFKGKVVLLINTTVGCGNAGQMESIQWIQEDMAGEDFTVVAIPTNDFCGPSITKGKWSKGITCGMDSKLYGEDVYGVTFPFSEMIVSNPAEIPLEEPWLGKGPGLNGNGQPFGERHELYLEISKQIILLAKNKIVNNIVEKTDYESRYLNQHDGGALMNANFEKYLIDKDGYVVKHYPATTLNWDVERTLKEDLIAKGSSPTMGPDRSEYIFNEENAVIRDHIERLIDGERSIINPVRSLISV